MGPIDSGTEGTHVHHELSHWLYKVTIVKLEMIPYILGVNLKEVNLLKLFALGDWVK